MLHRTKIDKTMKRHRKKVIAIFAACMFAMMMMLNVSTTINGSNFSIEGYTALVSGSTGGCSISVTCSGGSDTCECSGVNDCKRTSTGCSATGSDGETITCSC